MTIEFDGQNNKLGTTTANSVTIKTNDTDALTVDSSANLQFNSGYGSVATAYGCRAWVNFDGTGTPSIRGSGNVSSITDIGVGIYEANFTNAMPDTNYVIVGSIIGDGTTSSRSFSLVASFGSDKTTTDSGRVSTVITSGSYTDFTAVNLIFVR